MFFPLAFPRVGGGKLGKRGVGLFAHGSFGAGVGSVVEGADSLFASGFGTGLFSSARGVTIGNTCTCSGRAEFRWKSRCGKAMTIPFCSTVPAIIWRKSL